MREITDFNAHVGARIKTARESQEITQSGLARLMGDRGAIGFHQPTIDRVEAGIRPLKFQEAIIFASVLGLSLDELADDAEMSDLEIKAGLDRAIEVLMREREALSGKPDA